MRPTIAQRRVLSAIDNGGRLWLVADGDLADPLDDPHSHYVVAEFQRDGDLAGTWKPQQRTLLALRYAGLVEFDL